MDMVLNDNSLNAAAADFLSTWVDTFNTDKSNLAALYAPDASLHGTSSPELFIGRDRIQTYFHGDATVTVKHVHGSDLSADTALLVGHCVFYSKADGRPVETPARFTFVMRRGNDLWQVLHHHSSADPK